MIIVPDLCENLLKASDPSVRETLLDEASAMPDAGTVLLERASQQVQGAPAEAYALSGFALAISDRQDDARGAAMAWRVRAQALRAQGNHEDALIAFASAADCARRAGDTRLAAQVQIGRIDSLGMLGAYDEALALAGELDRELRATGADQDAAKVLFNAGSLHFRRDQYAEALDCYERAGMIFAQSGEPTVQARVWSNCANILTHMGRIDDAIVLYDKAGTVFADNGMLPEAAVVDTNTGYLHSVSGRYSAALAALNRARQEFGTWGRDLDAAKADLDIADVYRALNLYPEALACSERAIRVFEITHADYECARAELGRAAILTLAGRTDEAFSSLERADTIFRQQKNHLQEAHVRLIRAYLLQQMDRGLEAQEDATRAVAIFAKHGLPGWAAEGRFITAQAALEQGQNAVARMQAVIRAARLAGRGWLECRATHALGGYYSRRGDTRRGLVFLRAGVESLENVRTLIAPEELHVAFLRDKLSVYEDLIGTLLTRGRREDVADALGYVERSKSRLLLERVQTALDGRTSVGTAGLQAQAKLAALRAELSRGYHRLHEIDDGSNQRLTGKSPGIDALLPLEQAYHAALREVEVEARSADVSPRSPVISEESLRAALEPDEVLVEFYVVRGSVCAFVIRPDAVQFRLNLAPLEEVSHTWRRLRYHLQKSEMMQHHATQHGRQLRQRIEEVLSQLYGQLLAPLEDLLTAEKVVVVPHGILHGLPFHAFFDGGQHALDRWEFSYAPSAALWHAGVQRTAARNVQASVMAHAAAMEHALLVGVPSPGIERVADEVAQLACLMPGALVFNAEYATVESFRACAEQAGLIHLATHALFRADNPLFSGLRFADGYLLARDLYGMSLDCELATLSACRTGVTFVEPGDELFGLLRGFLAAGVRSVAASLWPADDAATAALMVRFYTRLKAGETKAAALRAAQQETRAEYPHPYHWAAFALVGERN